VAFDLVRSHRVNLDDADFNAIETLFSDLEKEATAVLEQSGEAAGIAFSRSIDMRFVGQGAETNLAIANKAFHLWQKTDIRRLFDETYKRLYGRTYPDTPVEFITFKVRASLPERPFRIPSLSPGGRALTDCVKGERNAYSLLQKRYIPFKVMDRSTLFPGAAMEGPVIIEEKESTIVVGEDAAARVDDRGFVWITLNSGSQDPRRRGVA
jgi:N-methylhydantoinase A